MECWAGHALRRVVMGAVIALAMGGHVAPALAACALAVALPPLAVPAYPETYRKTPVPFDAISVANGATLFAANCVACNPAPA